MIATRQGFVTALSDRLTQLEGRSQQLTFWWRDDDAVEPTPALDRLIAQAGKALVPLALAVIPKQAAAALADRLDRTEKVTVLQHGWAHANHQPDGQKKAELGDARPVEAVLDELSDGHDRLSGLFGDRFAPVLVPPWNRIAPDVLRRRDRAGLVGLSTFGHAPDSDRTWVNTHVDIVDWRGSRGFVGWQRAWEELDRKIRLRVEAGSDKPIGLLTHHLVHDQGCRDFLDAFLACVKGCPAVAWPDIREIFRLR